MSNKEFGFIEDIEAANATIRSLKAKLKSLYNSETASIIQKQMYVAKKRAEENQRRHNEAMRTILENVTFGFFVIDQNRIVQRGCSQSCFELLANPRIEGRPISEVLHLTGAQVGYFDLCVDSVFEDIMPEEVTLSAIPGRFRFNDRSLRLEGRVVRDSSNRVEKILFTVSDITALENAERQAQLNQMLLGILKSREAYAEFLVATKSSLAEARGLLKRRDASADQVVRRIVHTIKGNSGSFGMMDFATFIHAIEEHAQLTVEHIDRIERELVNFLTEHHSILEIDYADLGATVFEVSSHELTRLKSIISNLPSSQKARELQSWTAKVAEKPASTLLGPVGEFCRKLADRLDKKVRVDVSGLSTQVNAEIMRPIFQNLTHILRNSIDHGIEPAAERVDAGKPEEGLISIQIDADQNSYSIKIVDDGRGINTAKLLERAIQKGLVTREDYQNASTDKLVSLIFVDGLSSAETTTEISGRGVGMASVQKVVHDVRGSIQIDTRPGRGTTFVLNVPRSEEPLAFKKAS